MGGEKSGNDKASAAEARRERLAAELRANLKKRRAKKHRSVDIRTTDHPDTKSPD